MFISVNPSYLCNFRCSFCYLTKEQLSDTKCIDLNRLQGMLHEIKIFTSKEDFVFDLYGGEISSLPDEYVNSLIDVLSLFTSEPIRITSNFSRIPDYFYRSEITATVSYDYKARQDWQITLANVAEFSKYQPADILMLASKNLIKYSVEEIISSLYSIPRLNSLEIKPYSTNQANQDHVSFKDFEEFVKGFIINQHLLHPGATFNNELMIQAVLKKERNAFSDDHIYITPSGKFAVLEFDENDNEFFMEFPIFHDYEKWTKVEKNRVMLNSYCSSCEHFGNCLSEHLREVKDISNSCNGFKHLIDWYAHGKI